MRVNDVNPGKESVEVIGADPVRSVSHNAEIPGDARQQDTSGLKHKTNYIPSDATKSISPALSLSESKSDRGVNHPMLRDAIILWPLHLQIHARVVVEDGETVSEASLTPAATAYVQKLNICAYIDLFSLQRPQRSFEWL